MALFIAYLFHHHYAASTADTHISALSYLHKLMGLSDPTKVFFIIQMLQGYGKLGSSVDGRLLITLPIRILFQISHYELCLFRAMCSLAFYAFLCVGEMAVTNNNSLLSVDNNAKLVNATNHVVSLKVTFRNYKQL